MALINKIREKTGLLVGVVAFGLILFLVGGDILGPNSVLLGSNSTEIGEIAGEEVELKDFQEKVDELSYNFALNSGKNPNSQELEQIRKQAWSALIDEIAYKKQYDEIGVKVPDEEVVDMVQGNNISPRIKQAFTNPETGEFSKQQIISFLQNINNLPAQQQASWFAFEASLAPVRLREKYANLLAKTNYVTKEEARDFYQKSNTTANIKYLYVPYRSISDSVIDFSNDELKNYLLENSEKYQREESRSLLYVSFDITPTKSDSMQVLKGIKDVRNGISDARNDSIFAKVNSEADNPYSVYTPDIIPEVLIDDQGNFVQDGYVSEIKVERGSYAFYKMINSFEGDEDYARASHILIKWDSESEDDKTKAREEAQEILNEIKRGADFADMALKHGTDGTKNRGGDLGWFGRGRMVGPFEEAVFNANNTGLVNTLVETRFGYHIIKVTNTKTNKQFTVSKIVKEIYPSDQTVNSAYREADLFASQVDGVDDFSTVAAEKGLRPRNVPNIKKQDQSLGNIKEARRVVTWLYNEASVGEVSQVFDLNDQYLVAVMTGEQKKGTATLDDVRNDIKRKVLDKKKAERIIENLNDITFENLEQIADEYGEDANVYTANNLKMNENNIKEVGFAPEAVGAAFALEEVKRTAPLDVENGVIIIELIQINNPAELNDYSTYKEQIARNRSGRINYNLNQAIIDFADIEDKRYKFF
ncbi:MAG TPA: SurA N-terminal domain-containing protein [Cyclobacteriaceae bacterium]